jgi:hypothetical protein
MVNSERIAEALQVITPLVAEFTYVELLFRQEI